MMHITKQDLELLHFLHSVKVATYKQIHRDVYPEKSLKTVYNKVAQISKYKLISSTYDRLGTPVEKVMSLSKHGFKKFVASGNESRIELKSDSLNHDLGLVDIRYLLMNLQKTISYYTENEIQTWWPKSDDALKNELFKLQSDGLAKLSFSKGNLWAAIEYESTEKSGVRYESIVKKYYRTSDVPLVLYICDDERTLEQIKLAENNIYKGEYPKIFYQVKQKLYACDNIQFINRDQKLLDFDLKPSREFH